MTDHGSVVSCLFATPVFPKKTTPKSDPSRADRRPMTGCGSTIRPFGLSNGPPEPPPGPLVWDASVAWCLLNKKEPDSYMDEVDPSSLDGILTMYAYTSEIF